MSQIKSKERVRDLAEVYTNEKEVKAMLDLVPFKNPDDILLYRYMEPACGNGNFLVEILSRKLLRVHQKSTGRPLRDYEILVVKAVATIYGIDICTENVIEAKNRLLTQIKGDYDLHKGSYVYSEGFLETVEYLLAKNIVTGDSVNKPQEIELTEFRFKGRHIEQRVFSLKELVTQEKPVPLRTLVPTDYLDLGISQKIKQLELEL